MEDHLVRIHIPQKTGIGFGRFTRLEDDLAALLDSSDVGEYDGNEIGGGEYTIWLYGSDASLLVPVVLNFLKSRWLPAGCSLYVRHGGVEDNGAKTETLPIRSRRSLVPW